MNSRLRIDSCLPAPGTVIFAGLLATFLCASPAGGSEPAPSAGNDAIDWAKEQEFWSFRPPVAHPRPFVENKRWARQPIDYFILSQLEANGAPPSLEASKRTLIRRTTFDVTGLPPTPDEIEAFLADNRADAYERLVERLLASPRFGERMASLWLPLARYAEDQAHQVGADTKFFYPNAWRYREWIIEAFNRDLPYDRFIALQLAADKLEGTNSQNLPALGFLGLGPKYYNRERLEVMSDEWEDRVDTVCRTMLGLTVACARCHDHKFDPISMRDYYALAGVFASTRMVNRQPDGSAEKSDAQATNMAPATLHVVQDSDRPENLPVFLRGNVERKGEIAERRFLRVLSRADPEPFHDGSGRGELARAIANSANPLTSRVMVSRVWGQFFGKPLVATPSNFGHSGQLPSYPELLDDLAVRFMNSGWSLKALVREFVLSATYRQSSKYSVSSVQYSINKRSENSSANLPTPHSEYSLSDPDNILLGHMNRRRLSVEQFRDALLFVSGELDFKATGPSLELDSGSNHRRTIYGRVSRLKLNDLLMQFDYPDANVHSEKRSATTTATQKLFVLNSPFMMERAKAFALRVQEEAPDNDSLRVTLAYRLAFAREPQLEERTLALEFLSQPATGKPSRWEQFAQVLLASNEMLYVD
jgi:hypothetical protein